MNASLPASCALASLLLAFSGGAAATPEGRVVTESQNGQTVTLARNATLTLRLASNATTGYRWKAVALPRNLKLVGSSYDTPPDNPAGPAISGGGGTQIFTFRAAAAGRGTLRLVYRQPWRGGALSSQAFRISVVTR